MINGVAKAQKKWRAKLQLKHYVYARCGPVIFGELRGFEWSDRGLAKPAIAGLPT